MIDIKLLISCPELSHPNMRNKYNINNSLTRPYTVGLPCYVIQSKSISYITGFVYLCIAIQLRDKFTC